ncbi:MAG: tetratricopeptide repeat protein [Treponema sp.]|nr:tetratricopeptide repeat protein [Treponema sp.]
MKLKRMNLAVAAVLLLFCAVPVSAENTVESAAFVQGCSAFKSGDWNSAMILLRKAVSYPVNNTADSWYMLIVSEMYAGEYKSASSDCDSFVSAFPDSMYTAYIRYQKGRSLFYLGEYEKSVLWLSDFCHQYPEHEMYASALFWIAESFYAGYDYDEALPLYQRIISEYQGDAKAPAAQYRIETIGQRTREEKLLYLLKKTGEEYLSAKEDYEKQLKMYDSSSAAANVKRIADLQKQNTDLQNEIASLKQQVVQLQNAAAGAAQNTEDGSSDEIARLKAKAREVQNLLDKQNAGGR